VVVDGLALSGQVVRRRQRRALSLDERPRHAIRVDVVRVRPRAPGALVQVLRGELDRLDVDVGAAAARAGAGADSGPPPPPARGRGRRPAATRGRRTGRGRPAVQLDRRGRRDRVDAGGKRHVLTSAADIADAVNQIAVLRKKGKVFPYSLPSVGPGADPGVQAVSPQVT